jgi:hypothetical protein
MAVSCRAVHPPAVGSGRNGRGAGNAARAGSVSPVTVPLRSSSVIYHGGWRRRRAVASAVSRLGNSMGDYERLAGAL